MHRHGAGKWPRLAFLLPACMAGALACDGASRDAVARGDELLGAGDVAAAVAEYKLAIRQSGERPEVLLRLGGAFASQGDVQGSVRYLLRLLEADSSYAVAVAANLTEAARVALGKGDRDNMARALDPLEQRDLGLIPPDLRLELAGYYTDQGDRVRALPLYLSVAEGRDSLPSGVWYAVARAFQELGGCHEALVDFEHHLAEPGLSREDRSSARWHYGGCLLVVALQDVRAGDSASAEGLLDRLIELGVPRTAMDRAYLARGELRQATGSREQALEDYRMVLELNPARTGPVVERAEERIRELRFGVQ